FCNRLTLLSIRRVRITSLAFSHLARFSNLQELHLSRVLYFAERRTDVPNSVPQTETPEGVICSAVKKLKHLVSLDLSRNQFLIYREKELWDDLFAHSPNLTSLDLSGNRFSHQNLDWNARKFA